ncbi:YafY family protein [Litoribacillus peritrichatus]|uniref:YafY family protein n=1 Tax=Litoribacillus peritrichatus TaxID=718191 RepID=A0ABP7MTD9_9GAMM
MNKAERLFHLMALLRSRRTAITAEIMAEKMDVSVRTVYRDIQALTLSGIPIEGEAGIGYLLQSGFEIPPLMFSNDELQSLLVGIRMVKAFTDPELSKAAQLAEDKIMSVLPDPLKRYAETQPYCIPVVDRDNEIRETHLLLRKACERQQKLVIEYADGQQQKSTRIIWPLRLVGWGDRWTLLAWCELRDDYRNFRFDRINHLVVTDTTFETTETINWEHYITRLEAELSS